MGSVISVLLILAHSSGLEPGSSSGSRGAGP